MKKEYWALLVFVLIIVLQWIGLDFMVDFKNHEIAGFTTLCNTI